LKIVFVLQDGNVWDAVQSRMKSGSVLGEDEIRHVFLQLCMALQAMHENSNPYSHCDVKPHNLMMRPSINAVVGNSAFTKWANLCDMDVVLMDFGSVKPAVQKIESRGQALRVQEDAEVGFMFE
jgi:serine/threonine protein kinase